MATRLVAWSALALVLNVPLAAQNRVTERTLRQPEAEFTESFDALQALRELPDGKLLVTDLGPKAVYLVDFRSQHQTPVGRSGQGPGEYQLPGALLAAPGDTTLLVDLVSRRFLCIGPDGQLGKTIPFPDAVQGFPEARGVDGSGRVYFQGTPFATGPGGFNSGELPDSVPIIRWDRQSGRIDTLGMVKAPSLKMQVAGGANSRMVMMRPQPFAPQDDWAVGADGRVAVARVGDFHIEWLGPRPARGAPVAYDPVRVDDGEKDIFLSAMRNTRNRITVTRGGPGRGSQQLKPPEVQASDFNWPHDKPPFPGRTARISPDGRFWIEQSTRSGDSTEVYDTFDAAGGLMGRVILPRGRRLVGVGRGTVYAIRTDDDGLQWLERYRL
ncbi:MAG TPA: hypothetical protein VNH46_10900 [Gemmatimonadales bacterium]|nr:hypothetical protein [Gemmatimonadales bacterium]